MADAIRPLPLLLHLADRLLVHLDILVDHHLLEEYEVLHRQNLLQQALVDALRGLLLGHDEIRLRDAQILNIRLQLGLNKALEVRVYLCVVEAVLLGVLENNAVLLDKADDRVFPQGRLQKLSHDLENPLLHFHPSFI